MAEVERQAGATSDDLQTLRAHTDRLILENGRLKEERRRLMDISNELRSDLNKAVAGR